MSIYFFSSPPLSSTAPLLKYCSPSSSPWPARLWFATFFFCVWQRTPDGGNVSPVGVLQGGGGVPGDQRHHQYASGPDDPAMRMRRMPPNEGDLRDQRQRLAHEDMKQQHLRSMQPGLHRRPGLGQQLGGPSLDPNFYGGGHDEYSHPLGVPPRSSQQQFMSGGGGGGGGQGGGLRPISRDAHDMRYPPPVGYRDHQPPHSRGYGSPSPYGFLPPQMGSHSHGGGGGYGPGDNGDVAPSVPVSGVLNGRANLRPPPQARLASVAQPRARHALPPSPGRGGGNGNGGGGMSAGIMEGGGEGGRQGGNLSPFIGHQPSSHLRLPLPPVMSGGSFPPAFNNLDWDDGHVDAGGGGEAGGGGGGGPGKNIMLVRPLRAVDGITTL